MVKVWNDYVICIFLILRIQFSLYCKTMLDDSVIYLNIGSPEDKSIPFVYAG